MKNISRLRDYLLNFVDRYFKLFLLILLFLLYVRTGQIVSYLPGTDHIETLLDNIDTSIKELRP